MAELETEAEQEERDRRLGEPAADQVVESDTDEHGGDDAEPSFFDDPGQLLKTLLIVGVLIAAIYIVVPKIAGLEDAIAKLGEAQRSWLAVAVLATAASFAAYVALFRGVVGEHIVNLEWRESYQITMAGLAATRLFSAGGAGGIVLTYWALRKAGVKRAEAARRMVSFLVLLYAVYVLAVIVFGVLLRIGVLPGDGPVSMTIVPAGIAAVVLGGALLLVLIPEDLQRRLESRTGESRAGRVMSWLAALTATVANGIRTSWHFIREPRKGWLPLVGAIGFWAANITILWASFKSLGVSVPLGELVVGFFVGMAANLLPAPAGVGAVDGGLIGSFAIFGFPLETVIAAVLIFRLFAFYLPVPPGIVAFFQLRATVARWEQEREAAKAAGRVLDRSGAVGTS